MLSEKMLLLTLMTMHLCKIASKSCFGNCPALLSDAVFELELPSAITLPISTVVLTPTSTLFAGFVSNTNESVEIATSADRTFDGI